jgi:SRSO17 transposase
MDAQGIIAITVYRSLNLIADNSKKHVLVTTIAKNANDYFWYRRKGSEGSMGPIEYEFTKRRIVLSNQGLPQKSVRLLIRRTMDKEPQYSYFISNAPLSTRLSTFVWLSELRWSIEPCLCY